MLPKLCTQCLIMFSYKSSLNCHVKNIHGAKCGACEESKLAIERQRGMLYRDVTGDKELNGVSEIVPIDEFDVLR